MVETWPPSSPAQMLLEIITVLAQPGSYVMHMLSGVSGVKSLGALRTACKVIGSVYVSTSCVRVCGSNPVQVGTQLEARPAHAIGTDKAMCQHPQVATVFLASLSLTHTHRRLSPTGVGTAGYTPTSLALGGRDVQNAVHHGLCQTRTGSISATLLPGRGNAAEVWL
jgi:hypothetical protein